MKKVISVLFVVFTTVLLLFANMLTISAATNEFAGGSGTVDDPYLISNITHLNNVNNDLKAHYKMIADIDCFNKSFSPIGSFKGSFDGNGFAIKNLSLNISSNDTVYVAVFVKNTGIIKNLSVVDCQIRSNVSSTSSYECNYAAAIVAINDGTVSNCYSSGTVYPRTSSSLTIVRAGGLVAQNNGLITDSNNGASVLAVVDNLCSSQAEAGGITAYNFDGTVVDCYNSAGVSSCSYDKESYAGGIIGYNLGTVSRCYNTGTVSSEAKINTASSSISSCAGGIVGRSHNSIDLCYNCGKIYASVSQVSDLKTKAIAGGIAGQSFGSKVENCYNIGTVDASTRSTQLSPISYSGGIIGYTGYSVLEIGNCYNIGNITASTIVSGGNYSSNKYTGDIRGNDSDQTLITNCYSFASNTEEELKKESTFVGFDFISTWGIDSNYGYAYPQLILNWQQSIKSVEVMAQPTNKYFIENTTPDLSGSVMKIVYGDNTEKTSVIQPWMLSGINTNQIGKQVINLKVADAVSNNTVELVCINKAEAAIKISRLPTQLTYVKGQPLNLEAMTVDLVYNNNTTLPLSLSDVSVEYDDDKTGVVTVTVSYKEFSDEFEIYVDERVVRSISVFDPDKTEYYYGDELDLSGGMIQVVFVSDDYYSEMIPLDVSMITGYDKTKTGYQTLTVTYLEQTTFFMVNVLDRYLTSVSVVELPDKTEYHQGEDADCSGLSVKAIYNNGTFEYISDYAISNFNTETAGYRTIVVSYGGFSDDFGINVIGHSYSVEFDSVNHFDKCAVCGDVINIITHNFDNTCDPDCNCGFIRNVIHDYQSGYDTKNHFDKCTVCSEIIITGTHIFDSVCDSTCDCGYERTNIHRYDNDHDEQYHYLKCVVCGYISSKSAHKYDNQCDAVCSCGYERDITHSYRTVYDSEMHYKKCRICGDEADEASHIFDNDCDVDCICGYMRTITHDYQLTFDKNNHFDKCAVCGNVINVNTHKFVNNCDTTCSCGYVRIINHDYQPAYSDTEHYNECTVCGDKLEKFPHSFKNACDTSCDCGYTRTIMHNYEMVYNTYQHYQKCKVCGNEIGFVNHEYDNSCDSTCNGCGFTRVISHNYEQRYDHTNHWQECSVCHDKVSGIAHSFVNTCDICCDICGFVRNITHSFGDYVYNNDATSSSDGTKTRTCLICGIKDTITAEGTKLPAEKPLVDSSAKFEDVSRTSWYKTYVDYAITYDIFNGTSATTFAPSMEFTRAQFVVVLANLSGVELDNETTSFNDVPIGRWYTGAVTWAQQNGIVSGVGGGRFDPNAKITREQMCLMLVKYIENYKQSTLKEDKDISTFADDSKISDWAKIAVYKCAKAGLVNGIGGNIFDPRSSATRAQGATIFTNFHKDYMR